MDATMKLVDADEAVIEMAELERLQGYELLFKDACDIRDRALARATAAEAALEACRDGHLPELDAAVFRANAAERDLSQAREETERCKAALAPFVGDPECIVCQQYNLAKSIMASIDAQPDSGGAIYDDAVTEIYNAADEAVTICRHEHQDAALSPSSGASGGEKEQR